MAYHRKLPCGTSIYSVDPSCFPRVHSWSGHRNPVSTTIVSEILPKYAKPAPNIRKILLLEQLLPKINLYSLLGGRLLNRRTSAMWVALCTGVYKTSQTPTQ